MGSWVSAWGVPTFGLTNDELARVIYLGIIVIALSASLAALYHRRIGPWVQHVVIWVSLFAVLIVGYSNRDRLEDMGYRAFGMLVPGVPVPGPTAGSVMVARSRDGHFHVRATVDGHTVPMIVDTGASSVVLTNHDAGLLGIHPRDDDYTVPTSTANGHAGTAPVIIASLAVGNIAQKNVPALVAQPGALDSSLLGNSFLERLKSYTFEGDKLLMKR